jgi:hypothetical protein
MENFCLMLDIFLFDNPADEGPVSEQNKGYDNCYGNNYQNEQTDI